MVNQNHCRTRNAQGRQVLALVAASGVVISMWAVFPSFVESRVYVALPQASDPSAADVVVQQSQRVDRWFAAQAVFKTMSAAGSTTSVLVGLGSSNRSAAVQLMPLRSKLKVLLLLLLAQSTDEERPALEAKIRALLTLPDDALAQLVRHPDLAELSAMLDGVFLGTSDVSHVKTELDKITVTSTAGTSERVDVIEVSGRPAYEVRTPVGTERVAESVAPLAARLVEPSGAVVTTFALEPSVAPLPPAPPPPPMVEQARFVEPALEPAPSVDETPPPPPAPPSPPPPPPPAPALETVTAPDVMDSGNKFEPGETATQQSTGDSPTTEAPTSQTSSPESPEPPTAGVTDGNDAAGDAGDAAPNGGGSDDGADQ
jgi:hypothetical protein